MAIPLNVLANADDFGLGTTVNKAILLCFEKGYINSTSLLTNMAGFDEAVQMAKSNACIINVGIHINMAEGRPLTNVGEAFLDESGCWDIGKTGKASKFFSEEEKALLATEINAQIEKGLATGIAINHIDSHYHLHTLPGLFSLFLDAAIRFNLKMRLAQTYREGSYLKFWYRKFINGRLEARHLNYANRFETVDYFLANGQAADGQAGTEIMLHPDLDATGALTDHFDAATMVKWIAYLRQPLAN